MALNFEINVFLHIKNINKLNQKVMFFIIIQFLQYEHFSKKCINSISKYNNVYEKILFLTYKKQKNTQNMNIFVKNVIWTTKNIEK